MVMPAFIEQESVLPIIWASLLKPQVRANRSRSVGSRFVSQRSCLAA